MKTLTYETLGSNAPPPPSPLSPAQVNEYLDYAGEVLIARRHELIEALEADLAAYNTIEDDDTLAEVLENVRLVAALSRVAKARHDEAKKPFRAGGEAVDGWFKRFMAPLQTAVAPVQTLMDDYGARKLARQRAEQERIRLAAQQEADRLAAIAAARMQANKPADAALEQAAAAAADLERAEAQTQRRASSLTQTRSVYGAVGSVRETWGWEIEDATLIPRDFLCLDEAKVKDAGKVRDASGKPTTIIPGLRWVSKTKMGVR